MTKWLQIILLIVLFNPNVVTGEPLSLQEKIDMFHSNIVKQVQNHGLSGPIGEEAARYAQLRCIHEDGPDRPHNVSFNGMVPGSPNKEVMERLYMPDCRLSKASSNDGQGSYCIAGPRAHIMSATAIALWFDAIINSDRYKVCSHEDRRIWNESRYCSHMIAINHQDPLYQMRFDELQRDRDRVLKKANRAYGPQGEAISRLKEKIWNTMPREK